MADCWDTLTEKLDELQGIRGGSPVEQVSRSAVIGSIEQALSNLRREAQCAIDGCPCRTPREEFRP